MKQKMTHNSVVTSFLKLIGYFRANMSNSIPKPNFIVIELETTKVGGEGGIMSPPHTVVLLKS